VGLQLSFSRSRRIGGCSGPVVRARLLRCDLCISSPARHEHCGPLDMAKLKAHEKLAALLERSL